ncbi:MAG TPA: radical SAM protein [Vicinamibacterales bacterium]|nr:radical SAM protein [Vicinamibacterales bacterium]
MVGPGEMARRARGRVNGRLESLPILALSVHSACNCRCVMCDIWKANADKRDISIEELTRHVEDIRALHVQRVMLTGGEPLLHRNLWALCAELQALGIRVTLVTTGLLIEPHAANIARCADTVVVSLDGDREVHDRIRRVAGGFDRIAKGVAALRTSPAAPRIIARSVVQRDNLMVLQQTIGAARAIGFDEISFLAADLSSSAFNRGTPWSADRAGEVAIAGDDLARLEQAIERAVAAAADLFNSGFVAGGRASLDRILQYYRALAGGGQLPPVDCNAPWVSAVLEPGGTLRPCFFHGEYGSASGGLENALNSPAAIAFRRQLDVGTNAICRQCVCSLNLPLTRAV